METYEIHNREVLLKAMEVCAGPDCSTACPYKDKSRGGKSCRTVLLEDAMAALVKDKNDLDEMEAEYKTIHEERGTLYALNKAMEEDNRSVRAHRDAIAADQAALTVENRTLRERCQVQQNEINAMVLKMGGKQDGKTDRPSVCDRELMQEAGKLIAQAKYQEGRADALAAIVERCTFGGGCRHE